MLAKFYFLLCLVFPELQTYFSFSCHTTFTVQHICESKNSRHFQAGLPDFFFFFNLLVENLLKNIFLKPYV